jgi:TRAP transporter TAXI family solute receptor
MAALISKYIPGVEATARLTGGSAANMKLLHEEQVELALTLADVAWDAAQGTLSGLLEWVAVWTLLGTYSGYMHIVTLAGLGIKTVADLKGKRVSTGLPGSGTEVKGLRVFEASLRSHSRARLTPRVRQQLKMRRVRPPLSVFTRKPVAG